MLKKLWGLLFSKKLPQKNKNNNYLFEYSCAVEVPDNPSAGLYGGVDKVQIIIIGNSPFNEAELFDFFSRCLMEWYIGGSIRYTQKQAEKYIMAGVFGGGK